jgi:hypothetical protein
MTRLIAFGSSDTFGHYLETDDSKPSPRAWPGVLGSMLECESINNANTGSSNIEILLDILKFDFKQNDIVVVGWTFPFRDYLIDKNKQLGPWSPEIETLAELYGKKDMGIRTGLYISHAELYLESKNLKQQHFFASQTNAFVNFVFRPTVPIPTTPFKYYTDKKIFSEKDTALDGKHPGPITHRIAARRLYEYIK